MKNGPTTLSDKTVLSSQQNDNTNKSDGFWGIDNLLPGSTGTYDMNPAFINHGWYNANITTAEWHHDKEDTIRIRWSVYHAEWDVDVTQNLSIKKYQHRKILSFLFNGSFKNRTSDLGKPTDEELNAALYGYQAMIHLKQSDKPYLRFVIAVKSRVQDNES